MTNTNNEIWVSWKGSGRHAFPYPPGKEVELRRGFNLITEKILTAITGGIDSEGRARGGTAAAYWNAKPPILTRGREPMPDEEFHKPVERVGVTKSRKSVRRQAEREEIKDLRTLFMGLQAQILALKGGEVEAAEPSATPNPALAEAQRELEATQNELLERERELEGLRREAASAAELKTENDQLRDEARSAKVESASLAEDLDQATAPSELVVDPTDLTLKQLAEAIAAEGVTSVDLSQTLTRELGRDGGPRTGAVETLTKAIAGGV